MMGETSLQLAIVRFAAAVARLEELPDRQRAVALDIAQRHFARALARQRPLLEEWELAEERAA